MLAVVSLALGTAGGALCTALALRDPHVPGSWGSCPFLMATGLPCPTCGGLRATHDLLTGQWGAALRDNAYLAASLLGVLALAVIALMRGRDGLARWGGSARARRAWPCVPVLWGVGLLAFGVLRAARLAG